MKPVTSNLVHLHLGLSFSALPPCDWRCEARFEQKQQPRAQGPGQAHGLCFSVLRGVQTPPSLKNIYKELADDVEGFQVPSHGNLQSWADQGVFLLNATLTVRKGDANSHQKLGWQERPSQPSTRARALSTDPEH